MREVTVFRQGAFRYEIENQHVKHIAEGTGGEPVSPPKHAAIGWRAMLHEQTHMRVARAILAEERNSNREYPRWGELWQRLARGDVHNLENSEAALIAGRPALGLRHVVLFGERLAEKNSTMRSAFDELLALREKPLPSIADQIKQILQVNARLARELAEIRAELESSKQSKATPRVPDSPVVHAPSSSECEDQIASLLALEAGWDGHHAAVPSELAANAARFCIQRLPRDLRVSELEADVLGGLAIWLLPAGAEPKDRWVRLMAKNSGKVLLVMEDHRPNGSVSVSAIESLELAFRKIREFLTEKTG